MCITLSNTRGDVIPDLVLSKAFFTQDQILHVTTRDPDWNRFAIGLVLPGFHLYNHFAVGYVGLLPVGVGSV